MSSNNDEHDDDRDSSFTHRFFQHVEASLDDYISELGQAVAIPSISSDLPNHGKDILKMMEWTRDYVETLGGTARLLPNPKKVDADGNELPPILLAEFRADDGDVTSSSSSSSSSSSWQDRKTVCCYAHLDVQPASLSDGGWTSDPFVLALRDDKLYGRGSTDDKGPALSWLWVLRAHRALNVPLPVNVKLLFEGMEESGSEGMFEAIRDLSRNDDGFLSDVDFFCVSDNYWLGDRTPCLTYGLRGLAYFGVSVQCCRQDLHSGVLGGTVHEAMTDLVKLLASLVESGTGKILVPGIMDDVAPVTEEEEKLYETIDFDLEAYKKENKLDSVSNALLHDTKKDLLMARWRFPTLSLHGIEGAFPGAGAKTVM
mmetsp:Transcript_16606/g.34713  ORF Transcript_16606/g.34713 Transcript_16606/m.34713 type:complete len:371 (+) Transcript_16606:135-1247(+)